MVEEDRSSKAEAELEHIKEETAAKAEAEAEKKDSKEAELEKKAAIVEARHKENAKS